jgi:hypothetical protein
MKLVHFRKCHLAKCRSIWMRFSSPLTQKAETHSTQLLQTALKLVFIQTYIQTHMHQAKQSHTRARMHTHTLTYIHTNLYTHAYSQAKDLQTHTHTH